LIIVLSLLQLTRVTYNISLSCLDFVKLSLLNRLICYTFKFLLSSYSQSLTYCQKMSFNTNSSQVVQTSSQVVSNSSQVVSNSSQFVSNSSQFVSNSSQFVSNSSQFVSNSSQFVLSSSTVHPNSDDERSEYQLERRLFS
jgi:hypothetical protein